MSSKLETIQSEALKINLLLTDVPVRIAPVFEALQEGVAGYAGKEQQTQQLLVEYHHQYRDWRYVVLEAWRYANNNLPLYRNHPLNGRIVFLLSKIFLDALKGSVQHDVRSLAADRLLLFWMKLLEEMSEQMTAPLPERTVSLNYIGMVPERIGSCHEGILRYYLQQLNELDSESFRYLRQSFYQPKQLASRLLRQKKETAEDSSFREIRLFLERLLEETYEFWLENEDPGEWLRQQEMQSEGEGKTNLPWMEVCIPIGHSRYRENLQILEDIRRMENHGEALERLIRLPDFRDITELYRKLPEKLKPYESLSRDSHLSILMRLKIIETKGLEGIQEETLREINFELTKWIREEPKENLENFLEKILNVLKGCLENYPEAALQCVRTIGLEVLETDNRELIDFFIKHIIGMGFQTPRLGGVSEHWQIRMNPAHLVNIRIWLDLIRKNPHRTGALLSALIINLTLGGITIRDTDLFQKDVSILLHSPIKPVYNLVKQLAKLFPVYFSEIGAEGRLRAVSTEVDELSQRNDRLIHFLRKQSHVEGNNLIVYFIEAIINFWHTLDKEQLQRFLPAEVYQNVSPSGPYTDEIHRVFSHIFSHKELNHVKDLLDLPEDEAKRIIEEVPEVCERERKRALLMIRFYQLLHEKYALSFKDIRTHLEHASHLGLPDPSQLLKALESEDKFEKLGAVLDYLMELQEILINPCELQITENIYHKRHIAVDIPSMYGSYSERKFDTLGLTFRLEGLANVLFEEIILSFNLSFITHATFFHIAKFLPLFLKALAIDGITSTRMERQAELFQKAIEIRRFSHSQYVDIFRGFSEAVKQIMQTYYNAVHERNLSAIIKLLGKENLLPRYRRDHCEESVSETVHRISESFLRDLVARTFGLQYFDHFITSILTTLGNQREVLDTQKLDLLLSYDPEKTISLIYDPCHLAYDLIHLGGKGYNLTKLHSFGIQVPPGFIITTEYFRCKDVVEGFSQSSEDFQNRVMNHVERLSQQTGRCFGCSSNPLLLSVRSGSAVSMPGMMSSFLNVGINERIVTGLIEQTGESWFAWDNYRRFLQSWGMAFGMPRNIFDDIIGERKERYGRKVKRDFLPEEVREVALVYKQALKANKIEFLEDPKEQLFTAIQKVMESWLSPQAKIYRNIMGFSDDWGTAVTIQTMVYGNLDTDSGAGVLFTHNPRTSEENIELVGDFTRGNQGEDVVGGLVRTLALTEKQRLTQGREEPSLESLFPKVYKRLLEIAEDLIYRRNWSPQEIEFTFQGNHEDGVYILQSRNMTTRFKRRLPVFKPSEQLQSAYLGSGIGVSGGALSGMVAFDLESIKHLRKKYPGQPIIFLRSDTVPEDIREISVADGILTGKGGATSHAAIVAHRLEKTCVVGFSKMKVWEASRKCIIGDHVLQTGDMISIDGQSGKIYSGALETWLVDVES